MPEVELVASSANAESRGLSLSCSVHNLHAHHAYYPGHLNSLGADVSRCKARPSDCQQFYFVNLHGRRASVQSWPRRHVSRSVLDRMSRRMVVSSVRRATFDVSMRDPNSPYFEASQKLNEVLNAEWAIPDDNPVTQLIWATVARSKITFQAIGQLLGHEFDVQAAMLARPLFEDMIVAHWVDYNRDDPDWLINRFVSHREAMALDQIEMQERHGFGTGPLITSDEKTLRSKQNKLGREFKSRARRDWWDPGHEGKGTGSPIGIEGVAAILEDAAARHQRFYPRFAGGEEPMLRRMEAVIVKWFSRQLHHTALGLPFQPNINGRITDYSDRLGPWRVLFTAYWTFGQQIYLVFEHLGLDVSAYDALFIEGLKVIGVPILAPEDVEPALAKIRPWTPDGANK
jgi:hypothetical protein